MNRLFHHWWLLIGGLLLLSLPACSLFFEVDNSIGGDAGNDGDASVGIIDGGPGNDSDAGVVPAACDGDPRGSELFELCDISVPGDPFNIGPGSWFLDTDSGQLRDPSNLITVVDNTVVVDEGNQEIFVVLASEIQIDGNLRITGSRPVVLASWSNIRVGASISVVGNNSTLLGAGANPQDCGASVGQPGTLAFQIGGGGGGGSNYGRGGAGSAGTLNNEALAGNSGARNESPNLLRGGCPGGVGPADPGNGGDVGEGGQGGGAIALLARTELRIVGNVHAAGLGGVASGTIRGGGGGGGAGGSIWLMAQNIVLQSSAQVSANGGSGASGGNSATVGRNGNPGRLDGEAAVGAVEQDQTGRGGDGSSITNIDAGGAVKTGSQGGGGGGGGSGRVLVSSDSQSISLDAIVSPEEQDFANAQ